MSRPIRVLLVEDSEYDAALLLMELRQGGYDPTCERVESADEMMAALDRGPWDVVIADYVLPRFSGPAALKLLQRRGLDHPFIIVSGHIDEDTAVASMKAGAHDYVMKDRLTRLVPAIEREMEEAKVRHARRQSEQQFAREQAFRRTIEDSIPSGIAAAERNGRLTYVNPAFCQLVGWSERDLIGATPPYPFFPPEHQESLMASLAPIAEGRVPAEGFELPFQHRSGRNFDVLLLSKPLLDNKGAVAGWLASVTDITARKEAQDALRRAHDELEQRVRERTADLRTANASLEAAMHERQRLEHELLEITEKERRRIGLDLHDDLGQKLTGLTLMVKGLEVNLRKKNLPETADAAKISALLHQAVVHAGGLARDLALGELQQDDLPAALRELAANAEHLFSIACCFKAEGKIPRLERSRLTQFYKITQEAVTNAIKHGKATQVTVSVVGEPDRLVLTIRNNGLPFPSMIDRNKGMGLRIMNYRANVIGASLDIKPGRPDGTQVICCLPLPVTPARNGGDSGKNGNGIHAVPDSNLQPVNRLARKKPARKK